jgi:hypothetical protein
MEGEEGVGFVNCPKSSELPRMKLEFSAKGRSVWTMCLEESARDAQLL